MFKETSKESTFWSDISLLVLTGPPTLSLLNRILVRYNREIVSETEIISRNLFEYSGSGGVLYLNAFEIDANFSLRMLQNGKLMVSYTSIFKRTIILIFWGA